MLRILPREPHVSCMCSSFSRQPRSRSQPSFTFRQLGGDASRDDAITHDVSNQNKTPSNLKKKHYMCIFDICIFMCIYIVHNIKIILLELPLDKL